jgi:hydrogenase-4 membrane subunit HyfE
MGVLFGWFWSVAIGLQRVIRDEIKLKVNKFKIFLLIPVVYMIFFLGFFMPAFTSGGPNPGIFAVIFPLHLISMFCIFSSLYFVAKTFKTAELQRNVTFSDFAGEFFMIWFFPIGIWIVQPKINKMIKEKAHTATKG